MRGRKPQPRWRETVSFVIEFGAVDSAEATRRATVIGAAMQDRLDRSAAWKRLPGGPTIEAAHLDGFVREARA